MRQLPGITIVLCLYFCSDCSAQGIGGAGLIGTWDDVTPERERVGKQVKRPKVSLTIGGSACSWEEEGGRTIRQSLFVLAETDPHRAIDFVTVSGGAFHTTRALFEIEGDCLTIKEGGLGSPRPADLVSDDFDAGKAKTWAPVRKYKRRGE